MMISDHVKAEVFNWYFYSWSIFGDEDSLDHNFKLFGGDKSDQETLYWLLPKRLGPDQSLLLKRSADFISTIHVMGALPCK